MKRNNNSGKNDQRTGGDITRDLGAKAKNRALAEEVTGGEVELDAKMIQHIVRPGKRARKFRGAGPPSGE